MAKKPTPKPAKAKQTKPAIATKQVNAPAPKLSSVNKNMSDTRSTIAKAFTEGMLDFSKPIKDKS